MYSLVPVSPRRASIELDYLPGLRLPTRPSDGWSTWSACDGWTSPPSSPIADQASWASPLPVDNPNQNDQVTEEFRNSENSLRAFILTLFIIRTTRFTFAS